MTENEMLKDLIRNNLNKMTREELIQIWNQTSEMTKEKTIGEMIDYFKGKKENEIRIAEYPGDMKKIKEVKKIGRVADSSDSDRARSSNKHRSHNLGEYEDKPKAHGEVITESRKEANKGN